jgi:hypothetical protein
MPGAGASASSTIAAPVFRATIRRAASRSVWEGPTVTEISDIPSLTSIPSLLRSASQI